MQSDQLYSQPAGRATVPYRTARTRMCYDIDGMQLQMGLVRYRMDAAM